MEWTAGAVHLSVVAYIRAVGLGQRPRPLADQAQVRELLRINGDVGRFGGLLKLWLTDDRKLDHFDRGAVRRVLSEVEDTKILLQQTVRWAMHGRRFGGVPFGDPWQAEDPTPKRSMRLRVPVSDAEKTAILAAARATSPGPEVRPLAPAVYLRTRALEYRPRCVLCPERVAALREPRAQLARLGDFLKGWLVDDPKLACHHPSRLHGAVQNVLDRASGPLAQLRAGADRARAES